ncbi:hypothetical protein DO65_6038 [Burkholderia pseudomallei]|nr:hypothetical protein DO65_6038 [Burkholderia pseudomallei]
MIFGTEKNCKKALLLLLIIVNEGFNMVRCLVFGGAGRFRKSAGAMPGDGREALVSRGRRDVGQRTMMSWRTSNTLNGSGRD